MAARNPSPSPSTNDLTNKLSTEEKPSPIIKIEDDDATWDNPLDMMLEAFGHGIFYLTVVQGLPQPRLRDLLSHQSFWKGMLLRQGQIFNNMGDECVFSLMLGVHHLGIGAVLAYASKTGDLHLWRNAVLAEVGYEMVDVFQLLWGLPPYSLVQPKFKKLNLLHHLPNLLTTPLLLLSPLSRNTNMHRIASSLITAGGISLLTDAPKQTRSIDTQLSSWLSLHALSLAGVDWARFIVYFTAGPKFILESVHNGSMSHKFAAYLMLNVAVFSSFNTAVFFVLLEKLLKLFPVWWKSKCA